MHMSVVGPQAGRALPRTSLCTTAVHGRSCFTTRRSLARPWRSRNRRCASKQYTVATSEHWWEDEEEFDSLTDQIKPKNVVLVAAPSQPDQDAVLAAARTALQSLVFNTAISSAQDFPFAQQLWAGRDGPPYFHKVRQRPALDTAAAADTAAANSVWAELLSQNWRVELDYGLGVEIPEHESLLVVCSPAAAQQLLVAAGLDGQAAQPGSVAVISVAGAQGDVSWQEREKQLVVHTTELQGSLSAVL